MKEYPSIFRALRSDARNWWYHRELRQQGQTLQARQKEHASIRSNIRTLRAAIANGGYCTVAHTGHDMSITVGYVRTSDNSMTSSTSSGCHDGLAFAARKLLPCFRFDLASDVDAVNVALRGPMVVAEHDAMHTETTGQGTWDHMKLSDAITWMPSHGVPVELPARMRNDTSPRIVWGLLG